MKHALIYIATLCTITLSAFAAKPAINVNAKLKDGSTIKGEFLTKRVIGTTLFTTNISLNPKTIKTLTFLNTNGEANVELVNSDKFSMKVANEKFAIKSLLGELKVSRANFESISFSKKAKPNKAPSKGLIFHCTFDNEKAITSPKVGPKGSISSRQFVNGKVGNAVYVAKGSSAGFFTLPPETFNEEGCIEFWAKLEPSKETFRACDPRMIVIKSPVGWFSVEYSSNNGEGRGGFYVRCFGISFIKGGSCGGHYKYSDIIGDPSAWHHYAFSWSKDTLTTYIDGKKIDEMFKTGGIVIDGKKLQSGSSVMGLPNSNANEHNTEPNTPFVMDELKIWNYSKNKFSL